MLPAFFNPRGKFVRDVSIVCYDVFAKQSPKRGELSFADALCGIGARGIRVANELASSFSKVYLNDVNLKALDYARRSAKINSVRPKCFFSKMEACAFLNMRLENDGDRFDVVDIDPFGTCSPYAESAIRAVRDGGLLSVSATDSAVLCGVYPKVAQRKYGGISIRTDYSHEVGMRLIFGLMAQSAMRLKAGIEPLFCHHDMHYFRVYSNVKVGNSFSADNQAKMGFVVHCFECGFRSIIPYCELFSRTRARRKNATSVTELYGLGCPDCELNGGKGDLTAAGPLWIGNIQSREFVADCAKLSELAPFHFEEADIPLYYDLTALSKKAASRTPKIVDVMNALNEQGYATSRTRLNPNALRTTAPIVVLRSVVSEFAR